MKDYQLIKNHVIFQEVFQDTMGNNFRSAVLENRKAGTHRLVCKVNPLISTNPERLRRVKILLDGIKKAAIPTLFSPLETISEENELYLVYDYIKGRTLEQVMADAQKKGMNFSFDLALSIATAIADIIDSGATIIISGEKSFHGFLTPDNILFHYDGKIYLKNYGIFPYLDKSGSLANDFESRYNTWLTPEFTRKEKIVQQSDVYHLGFMIYRFITGKAFSLSSGEDFDAKINGLNLKQYLPTQDKELHGNVVNFFKKTLHPDPMKRFLSIKDFKDYIASYFHIEELSSITFNVAYFMNSLYSDAMETEERLLKEENTFSIPEPKKEAPPPPPMPEPVQERARPEPLKEEIISNLLDNIDKEKKSKKGPMLIAAFLVIAVAGIGGYLFMNQKKKAEQLEQARIMEKQRLEKESKEKEQRLLEERAQLQQDFQSKLDEQEQKTQTLEEEKKKYEKELTKKQQEAEQLRLQEEERARMEEEQKQADAEAERQKQAEAARLKKEEDDRKAREAEEKRKVEEAKAKPGQLVAYKELDVKPQRTSGKEVEEYYQDSLIWKKRLQSLKGRKITFMIILKISPNGDPQISSITGNPPKELKELVAEVVKTWKYSSPKKDNVNVTTYLPPIPINFSLT